MSFRFLVSLLLCSSCGLVEQPGRELKLRQPHSPADANMNPERDPASEDFSPVVRTSATTSSSHYISWRWDCQQTAFTEGTVDIENLGGEFYELDLNKDATQIDIDVQLNSCSYESLKREILVLIDNSRAMGSKDPLVNGSCGRMRALESLAATLPTDESVRLGFITYTDVVDQFYLNDFQTSEYFFERVARVDAFPSTDTADILCGSSGPTGYESALRKASLLLSQDPLTAHEVIVITAGELADDSPSGSTYMRRLKEDLGARISVLVLGDEIVPDFQDAVSKDSLGIPVQWLHKDSDELSTSMQLLANDQVTGSQLQVYDRRTAATEQVELFQAKAGYSPVYLRFDYQSLQYGVEIDYTVTTSYGHRLRHLGVLFTR